MAIKVGMVSLGCPKNQVDAEIMLAEIKEAGYEITGDAALAEVVIVNTCGFIESAKAESIENILEFSALKQEGKIKLIVVTGCLAERYRDELKAEIPECDVVVGIGSNKDICNIIKKGLEGERKCYYGPKENLPLSGNRLLTTLPYYAYIKIAEGCNNRCTYCAIPGIRGNFRSRKMEDIVSEARTLAENGVRELIVVAQDTTRYGEDIYGKPSLSNLLNELCKIEGLVWIRVLYMYPELIDDQLIETFKNQPKLVKYMDIPLQHISDKILKGMNRRGDGKMIRSLIKKLRDEIPDIAIRTTFIAGFPGETEEEFEQLCSFVKEAEFERMGCFAYSEEEGTPAAEFKGQVDETVRKRRAEVISEIQAEINFKLNEKLIDKQETVLVEGYDRIAGCYFGRRYCDAPEIDTQIFFMASGNKIASGDFVTVEIIESQGYDLIGEVIKGEK